MKSLRQFAGHPLRRVALWASLVAGLAACGGNNGPADGGDGNVLMRPDTQTDTFMLSPAIIVAPTSGLTTTEAGGTATFTVHLGSAPTGDVTIPLSSSTPAEGTVSPARLVFTANNWMSPQTVTVTGVDDTVADGPQMYTIITGAAQSSDQGYNGLNADDVSVTNGDNETAGITVTPTMGLRVSESGTNAMFTIALNTAPTGNVTIGLTSSNTMEATVFPASVVFTATNWNAPQVVRVTGVDDTVVDGDQMVNIVTGAAMSSDTRFNGMNPPDVSVTNVDNDGPGITVLPTVGLMTTEQGGQATFGVVLNTQPTADVTIALSSSNAMEGTVAPATLRFTTTNWNAPQMVTVTGVDDMVADGNQMYTIRTAAAVSTDTHYMGLDADDVSVTNIDNESPGVTITPTAGLRTTEAGGTATFTVVLNSMPTNSVSLALSSSRTTEGTVAPAMLTFTTANWNAPQTVTVTGVDDMVADGDQMFNIVTAALASMDRTYNGINPPDVAVTNVDNDSPGITVRPTMGLTTTESGGTATFTVVLNSMPSANVTIGLTSSRTTEGTVTPASLVFTSANWNAPQTVTVRGVDDMAADGNQLYTIVTAPAVSTDMGYSGRDADDVIVVNTDNDSPGVVVTPTTGLMTTEAGGTATFTVALRSAPTANVSIEIRSGNAAEVTVAPAMLTFTTTNFNAPQTVTLRGLDDMLADGNQRVTIALLPTVSADANYSGIDPTDVTVINVDNDSAGITATPTTGLRTSESGGRATFTVVLNSQPTGLVTVPMHSTRLTEGTIAPAALVFTTTNWNAPQTVTVTGMEDDSTADGDQPYSVVLDPAMSSDATYNGLVGTAVELTNVDNDTAGFTISPLTGLRVNETGTLTSSFTIVLNSRPRNDVRIDLTAVPNLEASVNPTSVTFTPTNWNAPQTVNVAGVDDPVQDGNQPFTIVTAPAISGDTGTMGYGGVDPPDVTGTNVDDDQAGITVTTPPTGVHTSENLGGIATFQVVLNSAPSGSNTVRIPIVSNRTSEAIVDDPPDDGAGNHVLVFSASNWNAPQTVTLRGVNDDFADGEQPYTVSIGPSTSGDPNYSGLAALPSSVDATNVDNDSAGITLTPASATGSRLTTRESNPGRARTLHVALNSRPHDAVVLALTVSTPGGGAPAEATVSPTTVSLDSTTWSSGADVLVTGANDDIADGDQNYTVTATVMTSTANDTPYAGLNATSFWTNQDDDQAGFTLSVNNTNLTPLHTSEGGTIQTFTVQLNSQPLGTVTITPTITTGSTQTEATISPASLIFDASNWNSALTFTVTGGNDTPAVRDGNQPYVVNLASTSTNVTEFYRTHNPNSVFFVNDDNDSASVSITPTSGFTTSESDTTATQSFTVSLGTQPYGTVTVNLVSSPAGEVILSTTPTGANITAVALDSTNWTGVTVYVRGQNDTTPTTDGNQAWNVATTVASAPDSRDIDYRTINPADVSGTNNDNDVPGLAISVTAGTDLTTTEAAGANHAVTYAVHLNAAPPAGQMVTVAVSSDTPAEGTITAGATLTFDNGNYNADQVVTVTGADDNIADGNRTYVVTFSATGGGYGAGTAMSPATTVTKIFTNTDNEVPGITLSTNTLSINESTDPAAAGTGSFTVQLANIPSATASPVSVQIAATVPGQIMNQGSFTPSTIVFCASLGGSCPVGGVAWNTPVTVTVTSVNNATAEGNKTYTLRASVTSSGYGATAQDVVVTDVDDDAAPVINRTSVSPFTYGRNATATAVAVSTVASVSGTGSPITAGSVSITTSFDGAQDALSIVSGGLPGTITIMGAATAQTINLVGSGASNADWAQAFSAIRYANSQSTGTGHTINVTFSATNMTGAGTDVVSIQVASNTAPSVTVPATVSVHAGAAASPPIRISASDVGDTITFTLPTTSTRGQTVSCSPVSGVPNAYDCTYTAPTLPGSPATDSFSFTATDSHGAATTGTVNISIGNTAPTVNNQSGLTVHAGGSLPITLTGNDADGDSLTFSIGTVSGTPPNGSISCSGAGNASCTYTPPSTITGTALAVTITFTATDGHGGTSGTGLLTISVGNTAPTSSASPNPVNATVSTTGSVTLTSSDADSDTLTYTLPSMTVGGRALTCTPSGSNQTCTFPAGASTGTDSFQYSVSDGHGASTATITVNINITPQLCGNGTLDSGEGCDDGDMTSGDGCSSTCTQESGFVCTGAGANSCTFTTATIVPTGSPVAIPDSPMAGITSSVMISALPSCTISTLTITTTAAHTNVGDLQMTISDGSVSTIFMSPPDAADSNFIATNPITWADSSGNTLSTMSNTNNSGSFRPTLNGGNSLNTAYGGRAANATWTITVADTAMGTTGTFTSWSLRFTCQ